MTTYRSLLIFLLLFSKCIILPEDKTVSFGIEGFPKGLDPAKHFGIYEERIYSQIYETLISLDKDSRTLIPNLATSWVVSDENKCFTFELRDGVHFHDGSVLWANDVKYSILRQMENNKSSFLVEVIHSVDILDSLKLSIRLNYPYYQFLFSLTSHLNLVILSKDYTERSDKEIAKNPVGTGPFKLTEWKEDEVIKLSSFLSHWQKSNTLREVLFIPYRDNIQREKALENEEVDILYMVTGYLLDRLRWTGIIEYHVQHPTSVTFIGFNFKNKPFNDIRVRKAILKSLNLHKLVLNLSRGSSILAKGPLPPGIFEYKTLRQEDYDINEAKELLKQAGYENGLRVKFYFPMVAFTRQTIIEMLENELDKVGISLDVKFYDSWDGHDRAIKSDSAQMFIDSYDSDILGDAHYFLYSLFHSKSPVNSLHYENSQVDKWLDVACREEEEESRYLLYEKVVEKILADVPAIFLFHVIPHYAYNRHKIKRLVADPYQNIQFHRIVLHE